jgi:glycosyltransferase involved in cell wall biosynthesis
LNIIHCLRAPVGGLFRHVCDLAGEQAARGHAVGLIADSRSGGIEAERMFDKLAPSCSLGILRIPMGRLPGPGDLSAIARIARHVSDRAADVLHGHGAKGGAYARLAGSRIRRNDRPLRVYTPHGGSLHYAPHSIAGRLYLGLERILLARTDLLIFESDYGRRTYAEKVAEPGPVARVIHNGLAAQEFTPVEPEARAADFIFIGELRQLKGVDILLHALAKLDTGATAIVFGEGAQGPELEGMAERLGLASRVTFAGPAPARAAFARGRCLVVPSRAESLPYIVLEGAAAGLPVIATDVGGISEIFAGRRDQLVSPGNADALAAAMASIQNDLDRARAQAQTMATDIAQRFSIDAMTDAVLAAYLEIMPPASA